RGKVFLQQHHIPIDFVLYVGNAYPHKNLEVLLDVAAELKKNHSPLSIVLVGRPDYFYDRLQEEAQRRQVADRVIFPGFVSDADLSCLYSRAVCYVFPSKYEGFGLPPLEAMLYDTPVVAARTSCIPEVLGEAALYFESGDVSGIIANIEQVRTDPQMRARLAQAGRNQADKYSWRTLAEQTKQIYHQLGQSIQTKKHQN
ncbi:MAG: glycosyltransferase family 1 protein, partial [Patescibacteria group bacterium]